MPIGALRILRSSSMYDQQVDPSGVAARGTSDRTAEMFLSANSLYGTGSIPLRTAVALTVRDSLPTRAISPLTRVGCMRVSFFLSPLMIWSR